MYARMYARMQALIQALMQARMHEHMACMHGQPQRQWLAGFVVLQVLQLFRRTTGGADSAAGDEAEDEEPLPESRGLLAEALEGRSGFTAAGPEEAAVVRKDGKTVRWAGAHSQLHCLGAG